METISKYYELKEVEIPELTEEESKEKGYYGRFEGQKITIGNVKVGKLYFYFDILKRIFDMPEDALLKNINVNNESGEFEITFYTYKEWNGAKEVKDFYRDNCCVKRVTPKIKIVKSNYDESTQVLV